jgi:hypothetical protein
MELPFTSFCHPYVTGNLRYETLLKSTGLEPSSSAAGLAHDQVSPKQKFSLLRFFGSDEFEQQVAGLTRQGRCRQEYGGQGRVDVSCEGHIVEPDQGAVAGDRKAMFADGCHGAKCQHVAGHKHGAGNLIAL